MTPNNVVAAASTWQFEPRKTGGLRIFEHKGVLVIAREAGSTALASNGVHVETDFTRIVINIDGKTEYDSKGRSRMVCYWGYSVDVYGRHDDNTSTWKQTHSYCVPWNINGDSRYTETPDQWIADAMQHLDAALATLAQMRTANTVARALHQSAAAYQGALTREQYDAACRDLAEFGVECLDDETCRSYCVCNFDSSFGAPAAKCVTMQLARQRLQALDAERETAAPSGPNEPEAVSAMTGQLWEACACGAEPVYMPLLKCAKCWPKAYSA